MISERYKSYYNCIFQVRLYQWKVKQYVEISWNLVVSSGNAIDLLKIFPFQSIFINFFNILFERYCSRHILHLEQKTTITNRERMVVGSIDITQNKNNPSKAVQKLDVGK